MKKIKKNIMDFSKEIKELKNTPQYLTFVSCAEFGEIKADKKTSHEFEVLSVKTIKKSAVKLVKKGLFNVNDGVFTLSKKGHKQVLKNK